MAASTSLVSSPSSWSSSPFSSYKHLLVEQRQKLLIVKFNRAGKKNALTRAAYRELTRVLLVAAHDDSITIVALSGVGDCFTAGNDLAQTQDVDDIREFFKYANFVLRSLVKAFVYCPKVIVSVVNGPCVGIGFTLSALCDVVYCTEQAYFKAPFTQLGICAEACSSYLLPLSLGRAKAAELLLFGSTLTASQALSFGFVAEVLRLQELDDNFWPRLQQYAALPEDSLRVTKRLLRSKQQEQSLLKALDAECEALEKLRFGEVFFSVIDSYVRKNKSKL